MICCHPISCESGMGHQAAAGKDLFLSKKHPRSALHHNPTSLVCVAQRATGHPLETCPLQRNRNQDELQVKRGRSVVWRQGWEMVCLMVTLSLHSRSVSGRFADEELDPGKACGVPGGPEDTGRAREGGRGRRCPESPMA